MRAIGIFLIKALAGLWLGGFISASALGNNFPNRPLWIDDTCEVVSTSSLETNGRYLQAGSLIYQTLFESDGWVGEIRALSLDRAGAISQEVWTTDNSFSVGAEDVLGRTILTHNEVGVDFQWVNLSESQRARFISGSETLADNEENAIRRLEWVRGYNDGLEIGGGETLRVRRKLLGDVINSNLLYVASQDYGYYYGSDTTSASAYSDYLVSKEAKVPLILVGANDGMFHGFDATNGKEKFAYVPSSLYPKLHRLWNSEYQGLHQFYVDGSPAVGDVYDNGWKTFIAGGFGYGGKGVFSLDVTDRELSAEDVLWERSALATNVVSDWDDLGHIFGEPTIARIAGADGATPSDDYVTIFGNGYKSDAGGAWLYIVDAKTGERLEKIEASAGPENGLSTATAFLNVDRQVTHVYAGDLLGNLWKFTLNGSSGWTKTLLFSAGTNQPITGQVGVVAHPNGGRLVVFGTGRYLFEGDGAAGATQALYGIWDNDTGQAVKDDLLAQSFGSVTGTDEYRALSEGEIVWINRNGVNHRGWYINLGNGERVLSAPALHAGRAIFTTFTPGSDSCDGGESWVIGVDIWSGGRLDNSIFDVNGDRLFNAEDVVFCGKKSCAPSAYRLPVGSLDGSQILFKVGVDSGYSSGLDGAIDQFDLNGSGSGLGPGRMSWRQLR